MVRRPPRWYWSCFGSAEADGSELFRVFLYELAVVFGPLVAGGVVWDEVDVVLAHVLTFRWCSCSRVVAELELVMVYLFVRVVLCCVSQCGHAGECRDGFLRCALPS